MKATFRTPEIGSSALAGVALSAVAAGVVAIALHVIGWIWWPALLLIVGPGIRTIWHLGTYVRVDRNGLIQVFLWRTEKRFTWDEIGGFAAEEITTPERLVRVYRVDDNHIWIPVVRTKHGAVFYLTALPHTGPIEADKRRYARGQAARLESVRQAVVNPDPRHAAADATDLGAQQAAAALWHWK